VVHVAAAPRSLRQRPDDAAGLVEIDETLRRRIEANKHEGKKLKAGRGTVGKQAVLGMREKGKRGRVKAVKIGAADTQTIQDVIVQNVAVGSTLHTDEAAVYQAMGACSSTTQRQPQRRRIRPATAFRPIRLRGFFGRSQAVA